MVKITEWEEDMKNPEGQVIDILGPSGDNNTEMHAILAEYGLPYSYPQQAEKATENQKLKLSERRKNTCYIYNDEVPAKEIKLEELELYLSQGWKKGRKPNSVKRAHGYKQPKMAWVHKGNEFKKIREENLESYLKEGWLRGRSK